MSSRRRRLATAALASVITTFALLAQPSPPQARANIPCTVVDDVTGGVGAITEGLIGSGNPLSDVCDTVTDKTIGTLTSPVKDALKSVGNGVFEQVTTWVSEGAGWLITQVAGEIQKTTTPKLTSEGFLAEYGQMAEIATVLAAAMLLLAILEALAQSSWGLLARAVLVNLPLAFIATSVAFAVVQLLLVATDGMCHAIAVATQEHSERFFRSALGSLGKAGGVAGGVASPAGAATGAAAVPLFVTFLAAIVGGFAAFFVWIELIARDASVYVVALFMPMALAASIWPRWAGALRRTSELLVVVIASKFVIVSIIALAAGLLAAKGGGVEHLLAASALMLLACFAPFMLLRLVPFAEGAMGAAYGRRSASGATQSGLQLASEVQIIRNMARSNWSASAPEVWGVSGGGGSGGNGGGAPLPRPGGGGGPAPGGGAQGGATGGGTTAATGTSAAGAASLAAAAAAPVAVAGAARTGARHLEQSAVAKGTSQPSAAPQTPQDASQGKGQARTRGAADGADEGSTDARSPSEQPPRPPQDLPAKGTGRPGG